MRRRVREAVILFLSSVMFALALNVFLIPSEIVAGGFSGLAIILNILFNMPVGFTVILLNIPFLAANARLHGKGYIKRAFIGVMLTGIMSEFLSDLGQISDNRVVNAVLGGALMGASLGCIFALGYTTGGTDLAATLIRVKYSSLGLGTALFICDFAIIMLALAVTRDVYGVALALISIWIQTVVIDSVMKRIQTSH